MERIERLPSGGPPGEKHDVYLVGPNAEVNAKLRESMIEVKHLVERVDALERWSPAWSAELPVEAHAVERLCDELGLPSPSIDDTTVTEAQLRQILEKSGACDVPAIKQRRKYDFGDAQIEVVDVTFPDRTIRSVAVEAADESVVQEAVDTFGLDGENRPMHLAAARATRRQPS
ncbi:hypothetical protein [Ilumatobacter nonamiensis]|uniref:hypothetical protein n=1 Tax=Ilumatobacter nonamiensis TaxID=467093 RepID=UPI00058AF7A5|nr:hypothetical protein [Ilumatobacter nonamiensis]